MYVFEEFINQYVLISTKTAEFKGILVEHDGNEEHLMSWGHYAHCLLSTEGGIIEIPDKDILEILNVE